MAPGRGAPLSLNAPNENIHCHKPSPAYQTCNLSPPMQAQHNITFCNTTKHKQRKKPSTPGADVIITRDAFARDCIHDAPMASEARDTASVIQLNIRSDEGHSTV